MKSFNFSLDKKYKHIFQKIIFILFNKKENRNFFQEGFTLIELAISLVIIGFIMGAILKGKDLIENARLKAIISQVQEIQLAISNFQSRYNSLPGDYKFASTHIKEGLKDGDQNGEISGDGLNKESEAGSFWSHLSASGLYKNIEVITSDQIDFGKGIPSSKIGGGFTVEYNPASLKASDPDLDSSHWIVLGNKKDLKGNGALLTPLQAKMIDQTIDTGNPITGHVRAANGSDIVSNTEQCLNNGQYDIKTKKAVCVLYFQF